MFSSARERALWLAVGGWSLAIWASIVPGRIATEALRERGWLTASITMVIATVGVALGARVARAGAGWRTGTITALAAIAYGWVIAQVPYLSERLHVVEYGLVALGIERALDARWGGRALARVAIAITGTAVIGWIDELLQSLVPGRVDDPADVALDAGSGALAVLTAAMIRGARRIDVAARGEIAHLPAGPE